MTKHVVTVDVLATSPDLGGGWQRAAAVDFECASFPTPMQVVVAEYKACQSSEGVGALVDSRIIVPAMEMVWKDWSFEGSQAVWDHLQDTGL